MNEILAFSSKRTSRSSIGGVEERKGKGGGIRQPIAREGRGGGRGKFPTPTETRFYSRLLEHSGEG